MKLFPGVQLQGHTADVVTVAISPSGSRALSGSHDCTVRIWDLESNVCTRVLNQHRYAVTKVVMTADAALGISADERGHILTWDLNSGEILSSHQPFKTPVTGLAITPDGEVSVACNYQGKVMVWRRTSSSGWVQMGRHLGHPCRAAAIAIDGTVIAIGSRNTVQLFLRFHDTYIPHRAIRIGGTTASVAIGEDGDTLAACGADRRITIADQHDGRVRGFLEGHTREVTCVALSRAGARAVSSSDDMTARVWDLDSGQLLFTLGGHAGPIPAVAISNDGSRIVTVSCDTTLRSYVVPPHGSAESTGYTPTEPRYTNAKVLMAGDSGVGKTALAQRLIHDRYLPTDSTDAAWATQMKLSQERTSGAFEREIWLWDFAGQSDYRIVHQLFMDETALAVLVFDPQNNNPFDGLDQWTRDLTRAARRPFRRLLVAGRCDRGGLTISKQAIDHFCQEAGFSIFLETSARSDRGCAELRKAIIECIPWNEIPWTASTRVFRRLKEEILRVKDEGKVLLRTSELLQQVRIRLPDEHFSSDEFRAVVSLLVGPGVLWILGFGDFVLLQPERINLYAAALIRAVRAHTDEIGVVEEDRVLAGQLEFEDMKRLHKDDETIVIRAMLQVFLERGLCLREQAERKTLLIFPSHFKRERPDLEHHPAPLVEYEFAGSLDEIYATLVVRLHHTVAFEKDRLWRFACDFRTPNKKRIGFKMMKRPDGTGILTVYSETDVTEDSKVTFTRYVHDHLHVWDPNTMRRRRYVCAACNTSVENQLVVERRLKRGEKTIRCQDCDSWIPLWDLFEERFASAEIQQKVQELQVKAQQVLDNESREHMLVGDVFSIVSSAGHIFRPTPNSDWGIDGEIEFKNAHGHASGVRLYLQLKSGDSHLTRLSDGSEVFAVRNPRHLTYWRDQAYPVMLVIRSADGTIRWMDVSAHLRSQARTVDAPHRIPFQSRPFNTSEVQRVGNELVPAGRGIS